VEQDASFFCGASASFFVKFQSTAKGEVSDHKRNFDEKKKH
jgi:hypothetical protein